VSGLLLGFGDRYADCTTLFQTDMQHMRDAAINMLAFIDFIHIQVSKKFKVPEFD